MMRCGRYPISEIPVDGFRISRCYSASGILVILEFITVIGRQITLYPQKKMPTPNPKKIIIQIGSGLFLTMSK